MFNIFRVFLGDYADDNETGKAASDSDFSLDASRFDQIDLTAAEAATLLANGTLTIGDETLVYNKVDPTDDERSWWERW